ncbi:hotdog domain-containing protein [Nocardia sp. NPDC050717]|uniref:acyl-CoA thioesterase n=1 Tax=Nocardia sp. NPDC050717 TaxID=3157221 RepID=UPI0033FB00B7
MTNGHCRYTGTYRVELADTDMGGAAHATCALLWSERAEQGLLRSLGLQPTFPRRRVEIDYLAPLFYGEEVSVNIEVVEVGTTSVAFSWTGYFDGTVYFRGRTIAVSTVDGAVAPVPQALSALPLTPGHDEGTDSDTKFTDRFAQAAMKRDGATLGLPDSHPPA